MIKALIGFEFDWFAKDQKGAIGIFASAGYGHVPKSIHEVYQA